MHFVLTDVHSYKGYIHFCGWMQKLTVNWRVRAYMFLLEERLMWENGNGSLDILKRKTVSALVSES